MHSCAALQHACAPVRDATMISNVVPGTHWPHCKLYRFMRDLPYGHDVLLENLLDPAHVPWAHHGVQGDRFNQPNSALGQPEPLQDAHGFSTPFIQDTSKQVRDGTSMQAMSASADADIVFKAPNLLK